MRAAATATVLLLLVVLAAAASTPWEVHAPDLEAILPTNPAEFPTIPPEPTPAASAPAPEEYLNSTAQDIIALVLGLLCLALLAWLGVALGRRLRDRYVPEGAGHEPTPAGTTAPGADPDLLAEAVRDAAERALERVERARGVPRDAVVAAWVALEDAAAEHGSARDPAHTTTEFTTTLLATTSAPATDVATLRGLYQRARFTSRPVTDDDVAAAQAALAAIARALQPQGTP
ncbi:DUF4129 domain-containing protein [Myceligenerans indicum]|uniref:DUF4129 domain-containing protein n=1 Tax=Myceligenerans indicum TaxID=2593663 RepID=A0ABS1LRL1_9MICO|nr:DUF4129 domain-containing protein [Myceligenerans indicum]MBL0888931.1 DUF4129 domain-containing protein [Myceligenerans indicum]